MAERIQLRRTKGWRLPEGAVVVARPSKWGNPFAIGTSVDGVRITDRAGAVAAFRQMLTIPERNYPSAAEIRRQLAGKDLACWCPAGAPCHADVLLELANAEGGAR